jgi:signal peptidase I
MRKALHIAVGIAVALAMSRVWLIEPSIVATGSMYPTLLGSHVDLNCTDCGKRFACDARDDVLPAACPNCGYQVADTQGMTAIDGDRLLINRAACLLRDPRRWEVVAFRCPDRPSRICIKRVVGLPGETVEIRAGDLYIDGHIVRKTLSQQQALAVPVFDGNHPPHGSEATHSRWHGQPGSTNWYGDRCDGQVRFVHQAMLPADATAHDQIDWLTYHHRRRGGDSSDVGSVAASVTDQQPYNRDTTRSSIPTVDVIWECRVRAVGSGRVLFRAGDGVDDFLVRIDTANATAQLLHDGQLVETIERNMAEFSSQAQIVVSLVDRQFLFAVAGRPWFRPVNLTPAANTRRGVAEIAAGSGSRPFAIATEGPELEVWELQVLRDVYYTSASSQTANRRPAKTVKLADDEFFVLGDNSAVAADSRFWPAGGGIQRDSVIGKPQVVHRPSRLMSLGWLRFQVPDLAKIRYIR